MNEVMIALLLVGKLVGATVDGATEYNAPDRSLPSGYHDTGKTVTIYEVRPCDPKYPLQEAHWEADHDKGQGFWNHACYRRTGLTREAMIVRWGEKPKKGCAKAIVPEDNPRSEQVAERCPVKKCNRWAVPVGIKVIDPPGLNCMESITGKPESNLALFRPCRGKTFIQYVCAKRHLFTLTPSGERE